MFFAQAFIARGETLLFKGHRRPVEHPGARRVEPRDLAHVENGFARFRALVGKLPQTVVELHDGIDGPVALGAEPQDLALRLDLVACLSQRASSRAGVRRCPKPRQFDAGAMTSGGA
jgi:hypothetical protein